MPATDMSIVLAMDQSTTTGSAALLQGNVVLAERSWEETGIRHQQLFVVLPELLAAASLSPEAIDLFAVGLGPGTFSGLRISLSAAQALAIPGDKPVYGLSSGEAIAWDVLGKTGASSVVVLGDARRHRFWYARFRNEAGRPAMVAPYALVPINEVASVLEKGSVVVTPHWDRIGAELATHAHGVTLMENAVVPQARTVGELVVDRIDRNQPCDELKPIYMHPPVFTEPREPSGLIHVRPLR